MRRALVLLPLFILSTACVNGTIGTPNVYEPLATGGDEDPAAADPTDDPVDVEPASCEDFVTVPHNACGGHEDFSVSVVDVVDDDGDGVWAVGETVSITVEFHSAAEWMNYPGVLADADAAITGLPAEGDAYWWYGVMADDIYEVVFEATLDEETPADVVELVFTVGALNCVENDFAGWECPSPSPLVLEIPR